MLTVVDATRLEVLVGHDLALEQIGYADVVVLTRADCARDEELARAEERVIAHNGATAVVRARRGSIDAAPSIEALLAMRVLDVPRHVPPSAAHVYESVSLTLDGEVDGERFADFMESDVAALTGRIFRIKGILAVAGLAERMIVQGVGGGVEITLGAPWGTTMKRSRLVVVGFGLERETLARGFAACAAPMLTAATSG